MKTHSLLFIVVIALLGCKAKGVNEYNAEASDTIPKKDSVATVIPLAFGDQAGYKGKPEASLSDSIAFMLIQTPEELESHFTSKEFPVAPNYAINFNIALLRQKAAPIAYEIEKAEIADERINVYLRRGTEAPLGGQLFALERRDGYPEIRFHLNGKQIGSIALVVVNY